MVGVSDGHISSCGVIFERITISPVVSAFCRVLCFESCTWIMDSNGSGHGICPP